MADLEQLVEDLSALSLMEAAELTKMLEEKWGVSAAAPAAAMPMMMPGMAAGGAGAAAEEAEEQTEFDVKLTDVGPKKINVIKEVRALTSLGLKEAKAAVEGAPTPIKEGATKEEAEALVAEITEAGGTAELK